MVYVSSRGSRVCPRLSPGGLRTTVVAPTIEMPAHDRDAAEEGGVVRRGLVAVQGPGHGHRQGAHWTGWVHASNSRAEGRDT